MKAVILAAGMGRRFGSTTANFPKALLSVADKPLLSYIVGLCSESKLDEIIVVGGFGFYQVEATLAKISSPVPIRLLNNRQYELGNLVTLATALPEVTGDFFVANADHIYPRSLFQDFLKSPPGIRAACDFDRPLGGDDMKIRHNAALKITAISKQLAHYDGGYIGMTKIAGKDRALYERAVEATFGRIGKEKAVAEQVLETLILWNENPGLHDASGHKWWEVDTPAERAQTERALLNPNELKT